MAMGMDTQVVVDNWHAGVTNPGSASPHPGVRIIPLKKIKSTLNPCYHLRGGQKKAKLLT